MSEEERKRRAEHIRSMLGKPEEIGLGFAPGIVRILLSELDRVTVERDTLDHDADVLEAEIVRVERERDAALEQVRVLREALESLESVQNGPPLVKWADEWNKAMELTVAALAATAKGEKLDAQLKKSESLTREAAAIGRSLHTPKKPTP